MVSRPQPEEAIRALLDKVLREEELKAQQATLMQEGNYIDAAAVAQRRPRSLRRTVIACYWRKRKRAEPPGRGRSGVKKLSRYRRYPLSGLVAQTNCLNRRRIRRKFSNFSSSRGEPAGCGFGNATGVAVAPVGRNEEALNCCCSAI